MFISHNDRIFFLILLFTAVTGVSACGVASKSVANNAHENIPVSNKYKDEMLSIAQHVSVQTAFDVIQELEPKTHSDHLMLTEIPAPPFKEERRAKRYAEMLLEAGADSMWIDEVGNVIAQRKGRSGERVVTLSAHLDTVFPEEVDVTVKVRGDTLFAPGIGDNSRGLVVVLTVLRAMETAGIETEADLLFIGTVGEEGLGDLRGVKHLFREDGPQIDAWIAVDGGDIERIVNEGLGSHRYRVTFRGPGGHSWGAFGLANPQHALGRAIHYFVEAAEPFTLEGERTSYNVGRIGGGTSINSIPFESWMEVDMRSISPKRLNEIDALFKKAVQRALQEENRLRREGPELTADIKMVGDRPAGETEPSTPIIQRALAATNYFDIEPILKTSSTDSNIPISKGIPAITISRGGLGDGGHSPDEWWLNQDGHLAMQIALLILVAEAGLIN